MPHLCSDLTVFQHVPHQLPFASWQYDCVLTVRGIRVFCYVLCCLPLCLCLDLIWC